MMLRTVMLTGRGGSCLAVSVEQVRHRDPLAQAARMYKLTPREIDVLSQILEGRNGHDISTHLHIAQTTVHEYFKHLIEKTGARNRSEMTSRVLDRQGSES